MEAAESSLCLVLSLRTVRERPLAWSESPCRAGAPWARCVGTPCWRGSASSTGFRALAACSTFLLNQFSCTCSSQAARETIKSRSKPPDGHQPQATCTFDFLCEPNRTSDMPTRPLESELYTGNRMQQLHGVRCLWS